MEGPYALKLLAWSSCRDVGWVSLLGFSEAGFTGFWEVYFVFYNKWNLLTDADSNFGEINVILVALSSLC